MRRPTLDDVAELAGVTAKTVSNVLLDRPGVAEDTRARVQDAVTRLGYHVNRAGRGLASGRSGRVAVVLPNLHQPYFAETAERLVVALHEQGLTSTLRIALGAEAERDAVLGLTTADADGVIICPHHLTPELLGGRGPSRPVVQLGGAPTGLIDTVVMGERVGFEAVTRHLLEQGRRRLVLLFNAGGHDGPHGARYDGFAAVHAELGLEPDAQLMIAGSDWDRRATGYEAMTALIRSGRDFDAVVAVNDAVAVGALRALRSHGIRVPEDVAVTGFDDTVEVGYTVPPLTSVSPDPQEMVTHAVGMLLERVGGLGERPRVRTTGAHLVPRASSGGRGGSVASPSQTRDRV